MKKSDNRPGGLKPLLLTSVFGGVAGFLLCILLLLALAGFVASGTLSEKAIQAAPAAVYALCAVVSGFFVGRRVKTRLLPCAVLVAGVMLALSMLVRVTAFFGAQGSGGMWLSVLSGFACTAVGAVLSGLVKKGKRIKARF